MGEIIFDSHGNKFYYNENKQLHREGGPAVEYVDGQGSWFINGIRHRLDGPAMDWANDKKYWYYKGKHIKCSSQEEFEKYLRLKAFW
jgi:hypothetical protein